MNTETSMLVSKIEKLWRKANSGACTPAERETFETKALSLMQENRITMAMLEIDQEDILGDHNYGETLSGRYARVTLEVIAAVARAYDCRVWWRNHYGGDKSPYIFGFQSDAERVILLSKMLVAEAFAQAANERGSTGGETISLRHSFLHGFSYEIGIRLREAARMANKAVEDRGGDTHGAELVLVSRRQQMHDEYKKKRVSTASAIKTSQRAAFVRGADAGRTAPLSTQGGVRSTQKALTS